MLLTGDRVVDQSDQYRRRARRLRSDAALSPLDARHGAVESLLLGEKIALQMLAEQKACHNQRFTCTLTTFDGTAITI